MPTVFCTRCGQENPEDARFCARCGAPLTRPGEPLERPVETTSTISISGIESLDPDETPEDPQIVTDIAVEGLPGDSALLVVKRGPNAGSRFLLDKDLTTAGRHPESDIFLDDVTVSRRHAEFHREGNRFTVRDVGSLNGTYLNRERIEDAPPDQRRRGPDRQVPAGLPHRPPQRQPRTGGLMSASLPARASMSHRRGARGAAPGVPRRHHLQDPLPRGRGAGRAPAHGLGLPQVLPRRLRPAALRAGRPARPLPPAAGHQGPPRGARPRPRAAGCRRHRPARAARPGLRRGAARRRGVRQGHHRDPALPHRADGGGRPRRRRPGPARAVRAGRTAPRRPALRRRRPGHRQDRCRDGPLRHRAAPPAAVPLGRRPRGRPARAGRLPAGAPESPEAKARADEVVRELAALSVKLHATLVKAGVRPGMSR